MKYIHYLLIMGILCCVTACRDIDTHQPFGTTEGEVPGEVKISSYEKIPGGVKLVFVAPKNEDLLYIKVKYKLDIGKDMEARASLYSDEISIEGFGNTDPKKLVISAVSRSEKEGKTISYEVVPGTPACVTAIEQLETNATFGGIYAATKNEKGNYLFFDISTQNEKGEWYVAQTEYTSRKEINFKVRGFKSESRNFKIEARDAWGNKSVPHLATLTPLYEEKLDLTKFKAIILPGDIALNAFGSIENLFNGNNRWNEMNLAHSQDFNQELFPVWFTFDMGQLAVLSRYTYWQRLMSNGDHLYNNGSIKEWEVWGRADLPNSSGSWDGWTKLMDCESIKPSGWAVGTNSEEDREYARKGEEFEFPAMVEPVRYIRFKIKSTHPGSGLIVMQQLWFYGTPIK